MNFVAKEIRVTVLALVVNALFSLPQSAVAGSRTWPGGTSGDDDRKHVLPVASAIIAVQMVKISEGRSQKVGQQSSGAERDSERALPRVTTPGKKISNLI